MRVQGLSLLAVLFACTVSSTVYATGNASSEPLMKFGTLSMDEDCQIVNGLTECTLDYAGEGFQDPLVFVMPTIDASSTEKNSSTYQTEYPSSARVFSVTSSQATIKQVIAPHDNVRFIADSKEQDYPNRVIDYRPAPMQDIDYFVIEAGYYVLENGTTIIADSIDTNTTVRQGSTKYNYNAQEHQKIGQRIQFGDYAHHGFEFSMPPGVLVEPQSTNNRYWYDFENGSEYRGQPKWMTGFAGYVTKSDFRIALELSEVLEGSFFKPNRNDIVPNLGLEKVAFVAGLGDGYIKGKKFWLGNGRTKKTTGNSTDRILNPVIVGCAEGYTDISDKGFRTAPVLVASKNSREGGNGGWLRRCGLDNERVAFIVEEDMDKDFERGHLDEEAAFFMFETEAVTQHCTVFDTTLASWNNSTYQRNVSITGNAYIENAKAYNKIGFPESKIGANTACKISDGNFTECVGDNTQVLAGEPDFFPVFVSPPTPIPTEHTDRMVLPPGNYDGLVDARLKGPSGAVFELTSGTYYFTNIALNNSHVELNVPDGEIVKIYTKQFKLSGQATINLDGDSDKLILSTENVAMSGGTSVTGHVLARHSFSLSGNHDNFVRGSVVTTSVAMSGNGHIIGDSICFDPPAPIGELVVELDKSFALTCDEVPVTFKYVYKDGEKAGQPIPHHNDSFAAILNASTDASWCDDDVCASSKYITSSFENGQKTLNINTTQVGNVLVSGQLLDGHSDPTEQQSVEYVPYNLEATPAVVDMIAGKAPDSGVQIIATACSNNAHVAVPNYVPSDQFTVDVNLVKPLSGASSSFTTTPVEFSNGIASINVAWDNVGEVKVSLTDPGFDCTGYDGCPIKTTEDDAQHATPTQVLNGGFTVRSRPWTFAVCSGVNIDGSSSSGSGFTRSGEAFSLSIKPVIWSQSQSAYIQNQKQGDLCNLAAPSNFFSLNDDFAGNLSFSHEIASPSNGSAGSMTVPQVRNSDREGRSDYLLASGMVMSEVGSFHISVDMANTFYDGILGGIESGRREVGRFYPYAYRVINDVGLRTEWNYPSTHSNFVYMGQPFGIKATYVEAVGVNNAPLKNFVDFHSDYQPKFSVEERKSGYVSRLVSSSLLNKSWNGSDNRLVSERSVGKYYHSSTSSCDVGLCWSKKTAADGYEDGPFNFKGANTDTQISLYSSNSADPVNISDSDRTLDTQPDIRFGRLRLMDVAGSQGSSIQIPAAAEYWTGETFASNFDDSGSAIDGGDYFASRVWPQNEGATTVSVSGEGDLFVGRNRVLEATQSVDTDVREQVEIWLDLSDSGNQLPWLSYNWDRQRSGEENPSAMATFGVYRGNDRVIYRGESNITRL